METQPDFKELLELLNAHEVEYLIVGAYALAFHGVPRATGDLDVWVHPASTNAQHLMEALTEFGFGDVGLQQDDFEQPEQVIQLGVPPVRIDLVTSLSGVRWQDAWPNRAVGDYGGVPVGFIGRSEFIANKRAVGRHKDLADIEALGGV